MTRLLWLHEDALRLPADFAQAEAMRAIFIWDEAFLSQQLYGLKRRVFLYECLLDLPIDIIAGARRPTLERMMQHADQLVTWRAQNPETRELMASLAKEYDVIILEPEPFITPLDTDKTTPPRRFFKYWKSIAPRALAKDGRLTD
jgi:hypothetical protein